MMPYPIDCRMLFTTSWVVQEHEFRIVMLPAECCTEMSNPGRATQSCTGGNLLLTRFAIQGLAAWPAGQPTLCRLVDEVVTGLASFSSNSDTDCATIEQAAL